MSAYDVGVIGLGRVGLPLALSLAKHGLKVLGFEIDDRIVRLVNGKTMPFKEKGYDELIRQVELEATSDMTRIRDAAQIVITVGTPLLNHIETDLSQISAVLKQLAPHLKQGQHVILRSTVAPGTTDYVRNTLESMTGLTAGKQFFLSFCPERIAEGKAMEELEKLPQIIGCTDDESFRLAAELFGRLTPDLLRTDYRSAELTKLFNNISRYVYFAVSNQFAMIAEQFGADIYEILHLANYRYPRGVAAAPGFTAGTCLRKDFGMLNETVPYADLFLNAWKVNEYMPKFVVDQLNKRRPLQGAAIAVLGYTFKKDTDDMRDSLVPKLCRYLAREVPGSLRIHEPYLPLGPITDRSNAFAFENVAADKALKGADIVVVAVNHTPFAQRFREIAGLLSDERVWLADLWNVGGCGKLFYQKKDLDGR